jgi:hypothetical protein
LRRKNALIFKYLAIIYRKLKAYSRDILEIAESCGFAPRAARGQHAWRYRAGPRRVSSRCDLEEESRGGGAGARFSV